MIIRVTGESLTIEATDPAIVALARAAIEAVGGRAQEAGVIRGDQPGSAGLGQVWLALRDSLEDIRERAARGPRDSGGEEGGPEKGRPAA